jgi:phosphate/sulfate permease
MQVNYLAVLAAAVSSFLLGGLWYSRMLFGPTWQSASGDTRKKEDGHPARVFGLSFLFALAAAMTYAWLIPIPVSVSAAGVQGLCVGAGLVAACFGINYQFANRSGVLWLIDAGYHTLQFGIYGVILGAWR